MISFYFILNNRSYILVIAENKAVAKEAFEAIHRDHYTLSQTEPNTGTLIETITQRLTE
jgi:hypothetical protein